MMLKHATPRFLCLATAAFCLSLGFQPRDADALSPGELRAPAAEAAPGALEQRLLGGDPRLEALYERHGFRPLWLAAGDTGLSARGESAIRALAEAELEGLDPARYRVGEIEAAQAAGDWQELELLISAALLGYAEDLLHGREDLRDLGAGFDGNGTPDDPVAAVSRVVAAQDVAGELQDLTPRHPQYERLRRTLAELRERAAEGGWPRVPEGETLDPGMRDPRVVVLRQRLAATAPEQAEAAHAGGDAAADPAFYDAALEQAVRAFQRRSGLAEDGRVGPRTLAALNRSVGDLIAVVQANMERWRWLPRDLGGRYILVNTAGYEMQAVEGGEVALRMPVVSGRPSRETPLFSAEMSYLEVNPTWTVPPTIFAKDYLPKLREDPGYLARQNITLYASWSQNAAPVDPYGVDWHAVPASTRSLPYRLVQSPGPHNALGRIKFMMPNRHSIYLHDTNHPELFARSRRALSSGCVRLERPDELAKLVIGDAEGWDMDRLDSVYASGQRTRISLQRTWPVHMTYFTAWVEADGTTRFFDDVYGHDETLIERLGKERLLLAEEPVQVTEKS